MIIIIVVIAHHASSRIIIIIIGVSVARVPIRSAAAVDRATTTQARHSRRSRARTAHPTPPHPHSPHSPSAFDSARAAHTHARTRTRTRARQPSDPQCSPVGTRLACSRTIVFVGRERFANRWTPLCGRVCACGGGARVWRTTSSRALWRQRSSCHVRLLCLHTHSVSVCALTCMCVCVCAAVDLDFIEVCDEGACFIAEELCAPHAAEHLVTVDAQCTRCMRAIG
jgi:hypothetical protein